MSIVTLTTDFGLNDWFVGVMKGVILNTSPSATLVDLTHLIDPGDLRAGAFSLRAAVEYFPKSTIHLAVVDPGVGGERKAIALKSRGQFFVGPDNGLLSWAAPLGTIEAIHAVENSSLRLERTSQTFHGRDVFAPAAAHLARGTPVGELGPALKGIVELPWPLPCHKASSVIGEIVYFDRFGNAVTNISGREIEGFGDEIRTSLGVLPLAASYGAVAQGNPLLIMGSCDLLEIAIHGGSARAVFGLKMGQQLRLSSDRRGLQG